MFIFTGITAALVYSVIEFSKFGYRIWFTELCICITKRWSVNWIDLQYVALYLL